MAGGVEHHSDLFLWLVGQESGTASLACSTASLSLRSRCRDTSLSAARRTLRATGAARSPGSYWNDRPVPPAGGRNTASHPWRDYRVWLIHRPPWSNRAAVRRKRPACVGQRTRVRSPRAACVVVPCASPRPGLNALQSPQASVFRCCAWARNGLALVHSGSACPQI